VSVELKLERESLEMLLARNRADADAWLALKADGWLDTHPDGPGPWELASIAALTSDAVSRAGRPLSPGAHLAAAAALGQAGDARSGLDELAVLVDGRPGNDGTITGRLWGGRAATYIVVDSGDSLTAVPRERCALGPDPLVVFDDVCVWQAQASTDGIESLTADPADVAVHRGRIAYLLAVEAVAGAGAAIAATLRYLEQRRQFGHKLGSLQALQHRAVDMHVTGAMGTALVDRATSAWTSGDGVLESWTAKLFASRRTLWAAEQAIQLHGGIGFTWELGLHAAVRRAQRARLLLGGPRQAAEEVLSRTSFGDAGLEDWSRRPDPHGLESDDE
jgi:hypothetical protein